MEKLKNATKKYSFTSFVQDFAMFCTVIITFKLLKFILYWLMESWKNFQKNVDRVVLFTALIMVSIIIIVIT